MGGLLAADPALAACSSAIGTPLNDVVTCTAGPPDTPSIDLTQGGNDSLTVHGGNVPGPVDFGPGNDEMVVNGGALGPVDQGNGADTFTMSDGTIQSLNQGSSIDTAVVSGGRIIGLFFAGDIFTMTGGRIGEVNLEQANNVMRMSGGTIDTNVSAAQGNDLLELTGGLIGGFVNLGNGNNTITVSGGQIDGGLTTGAGTDTFVWSDGGKIAGSINLGAGTDFATLRNLTATTLAAVTQFDGGADVDQLVFDNTVATGAAQYLNWENISLVNGAQLTLNSNMILGDAGTLTGTLSIDATSKLFAGGGANPTIGGFGNVPVTVTNAGGIDLTNGGSGPTDRLNIAGNYVGAGGFLALQTVLGSDSASSDRLVISGAGSSATGTTMLRVSNFGGTGALTAGNGILVVEAAGGATTTPGAFTLTAPVAAGMYEYQLFKGGVGGAFADSWYLRSSTIVSGGAAPELLPPGSEVLPNGDVAAALIRPEVPVQAMAPAIARRLGLVTMGTYHERVGFGNDPARNGDGPLSWARTFGQSSREYFKGDVRPDFDGTFAGLQAGRHLWSTTDFSGVRNDVGVFLGYAQARGNARGLALGVDVIDVGRIDLNAASFGAYWTRVGPAGWYVDMVTQGSLIDGSAQSNRGIGATTNGTAFAASIEGGYPIAMGGGVFVEPQAQLVWQLVSLDRTRDAFSTIQFNQSDVFSGRVGARIFGDFGQGVWKPYIKGNVWWASNGSDVVMFGADPVTTRFNNSTIGEIGGGIDVQFTKSLTAYASASYFSELSGTEYRAAKGNVGLRAVW